MKKLLISILTIMLVVGISTVALADWSVTVNWTASPDAASEVLLLAGVEQTCPQAGSCVFTVPLLESQSVVVRSSNSQGGFVDYVAGNLLEESLPTPAGDAIIVITIIN